MRGKAARYAGPLPCQRITPAHAGKRGCSRSARRIRRDHPRACGEKCAISLVTIGKPGSPPRMRGKDRCYGTYVPLWRITPAHAGKRNFSAAKRPQRQDHPRACGEKLLLIGLVSSAQGSPPRMRGKVRVFSPSSGSGGITPAHAGKRFHPYQSYTANRDHPRACGEKTKKIPYYRLFPLRSAPFSFSFA